jgi:hypothetical protein
LLANKNESEDRVVISLENTAGRFNACGRDLPPKLKDGISRQIEAQFEAEVEAGLQRQP